MRKIFTMMAAGAAAGVLITGCSGAGTAQEVASTIDYMVLGKHR